VYDDLIFLSTYPGTLTVLIHMQPDLFEQHYVVRGRGNCRVGVTMCFVGRTTVE